MNSFSLSVLLFLIFSFPGHSQVSEKEELFFFADTLYKRQILDSTSFLKIRSEIENGEIKNGAIDYLPYCKYSRIIDLKKYNKKKISSQQYILAIYTDIATLVPGFKSKILTVCDHQIGKTPCAETGPSVPDVKYSDHETQRRHWWLKEKTGPGSTPQRINVSDGCGTCLDSESELVRLINQMLNDQKSEWQLAIVEQYQPEAGKMKKNDSVFGVIALTKSQGEFLFNSEKPWFSIEAVYQGYITHAHMKRAIEKYREVGLLSHLSTIEIETISKKVMRDRFTNFNDVLALFPGVILPMNKQAPKVSYDELIKKLTVLSKGNFKPQEFKVITIGPIENNEIKCSFKLNGKKFESNVFDNGGTNEFYKFLNNSLEEANIDRGVHLLFPTRQAELKGIGDRIIWLTDLQHKNLTDAGYWSSIPNFSVPDDGLEEFINQTKSSWEKFYRN